MTRAIGHRIPWNIDNDPRADHNHQKIEEFSCSSALILLYSLSFLQFQEATLIIELWTLNSAGTLGMVGSSWKMPADRSNSFTSSPKLPYNLNETIKQWFHRLYSHHSLPHSLLAETQPNWEEWRCPQRWTIIRAHDEATSPTYTLQQK